MGAVRVFGQVVTPAGLLGDGLVVIAGGHVEYAGPRDVDRAVAGAPGSQDDGEAFTAPPGGLVLPALVDVHNHGGGGWSFHDGGASVAAAAEHHLRRGTGSVVAGIVTDDPAHMLAAVSAAADAVEVGAVAGIHLEGPFLSRPCRGAQDARFLAEPDLELTGRLLEAGRGHVRTMTLAPELPGAAAVTSLLLEQGVVPAVGHTEAPADLVHRTLAHTYDELGRPGLVTHLFNGMTPLHHRRPGPIAAALSAAARGHAVVELIADGVHLHDDVVRMVFDLLGPERVVLVTDAMAAAGMPDGEYDLGSQHVHVAGGVARLGAGEDAPLAGGTSHLLDVVRRCVSAGVPVVDAVAAATRTPAAALGRDTGILRAGSPADLLVTDADLRLVRVMRAGVWVD